MLSALLAGADLPQVRLSDHFETPGPSLLAESCRLLGIPQPWPEDALVEAMRQTVTANRIEEGAIRLTVTRGAGTGASICGIWPAITRSIPC